MKRRNFLSGLLAAPMALKARLPLLAGLFARKPRMQQLTPIQRQIIQLIAEGKSKEAAHILDMLHAAKLRTARLRASFKGMSLN